MSSPTLEVDPKSKGVRFVLVYLEQVEKGKALADKYRLHMGKDSPNKVPIPRCANSRSTSSRWFETER